MVISLRCLFLGHDDMMVRAPARLYLRCDHCGRESAGWTLTGSRRLRKVQGGMPSALNEPMPQRERRREEPIAA